MSAKPATRLYLTTAALLSYVRDQSQALLCMFETAYNFASRYVRVLSVFSFYMRDYACVRVFMVLLRRKEQWKMEGGRESCMGR